MLSCSQVCDLEKPALLRGGRGEHRPGWEGGRNVVKSLGFILSGEN